MTLISISHKASPCLTNLVHGHRFIFFPFCLIVQLYYVRAAGNSHLPCCSKTAWILSLPAQTFSSETVRSLCFSSTASLHRTLGAIPNIHTVTFEHIFIFLSISNPKWENIKFSVVSIHDCLAIKHNPHQSHFLTISSCAKQVFCV